MEAVAKEKLLNPEVYLNSSILHPLVYIGTYAKSNADSIFIYRLNTANGELIHVESVKGGERPSYLAFDHQRKYLYTVNEQEEDGDGAVTSFSVDPKSGKLTKVNQQPCPGGPCHLTVDNKNKVLLVANYGKGSVSVFPIQDNGQLSPASDTKQHQGSSVNKERQEGPHCHYITEDPDHSHVLVIDLGMDKVLSYRLDSENGKLTASNPSTAYAGEQGAGPRHLVFHPNKPFAYLINELNSTISVLKYDSEKGVFTARQIIHTIPPNFVEENTCAAIQISPNGKFLYGSNRGHDSIVVCEIAEDTGKLALVEFVSTGGISPRDFTIDLTGNILIVGNQKSNSVLTYKIEHQTGMLTQTGYKIEVPQPVCLKVIPDFAD